MTVRIDWISDARALDSLEGPWRALEAAVPERTHLSTFDFLTTWYRHYAGAYGGTPLVGVAWDGAQLVGVAPLTIRRGTIGRIPVTRVEFAPNDSVAGEFLIRDDRPDLAATFLEGLVRHARFDVVCLNGFAPDSRQLLALEGAAARHRLAARTEEHACAVVDLRGGYDAYRGGLSGNTRRKIVQKARRLEAAGALVDGVQPGDRPGAVERAIARMIAITEASYKLQGRRLDDCHRGFLAELIARFGARGMLSLPILSIGGRDAAFVLGVVDRGCFYDISLAYDESFADVSPGFYLMQDTLRRLAAAGVHTVVSHGAHEYKRRWASTFVPQTRLFLFARRPRAAATRFVRFGLAPLWQRFAPTTRLFRLHP